MGVCRLYLYYTTPDYLSISDYARPYVAIALEKGLISGYEDNTFRGQNSITRAEAATLLWRAYQYGSGNKVSTDKTPYVPTTTPAPNVSVATPTPTATPTPESTVEPTATPEPESRYVMDTITTISLSIREIFSLMTSDDNNNMYYYNNDDNTIYKLGMDSEEIDVVCEVSELMMSEEKQFDYNEDEYGKDENNIVEYYKEFETEQLYYDKIHERLLIKGRFRKMTDWYGLEDKGVYESAIIDITEKPKYCLSMNNDIALVLSNGNYLSTYWGDTYDSEGNYVGRSIETTDNGYWSLYYQSGNDIYRFGYSGMDLFERCSITKYDWSKGGWTSVAHFEEKEIDAYFCGLKDDSYYVWDVKKAQIIKINLNGKLTKFMDTSTGIEIIDMKIAPSATTSPYANTKNLFISDNGSVLFYDNGSIRVIKER